MLLQIIPMTRFRVLSVPYILSSFLDRLFLYYLSTIYLSVSISLFVAITLSRYIL
jgi:hypothetical protein